MITRRQVKAPIAPPHLCPQLCSVRHIPFHSFIIRSVKPLCVAAWPQQGLYAMPTFDQFMDKVRTDKSRRASYKTIHNARSGLKALATMSKIKIAPSPVSSYQLRFSASRPGTFQFFQNLLSNPVRHLTCLYHFETIPASYAGKNRCQA